MSLLSTLRRRYRDLVKARETLEKQLVRKREYFQGSLATIAHPNKTGPSTPYHYISCKREGARGVIYVRRKNLQRAKRLIGNWQDFKRDMKQLKVLNQDITKLLEELIEAQTIVEVNSDR